MQLKRYNNFKTNESKGPLDYIDVHQIRSINTHNGPSYNWTEFMNRLFASKATAFVFEIEGVCAVYGQRNHSSFELTLSPIGNMRTADFKKGSGTNFDLSVLFPKKKSDLALSLELVVRNCSRAALVDKINFSDFEIQYDNSLSRFGFSTDKHKFDPTKNLGDLINWVDYAPQPLVGQGHFDEEQHQLVEALKQLEDMLPENLTITLSY